MIPPSWPGIDPTGRPYDLHVRTLARLANVAEEARRWMVVVCQDVPLSKVLSKVPSDKAAHWLEACQDAYASSHKWGPACLVEQGERKAHILVVNGLLQAINETIEHAAEYLGMVGEDRFYHGTHAAIMVALALSKARVLNEP